MQPTIHRVPLAGVKSKLPATIADQFATIWTMMHAAKRARRERSVTKIALFVRTVESLSAAK
jgi:hypothetical protein